MKKLIEHILGQTERAWEIQSALTAVPALGPENGGQGELEKARLVESFLAAGGVSDILRFDSSDPRVESGLRPNLAAILPGKSPRCLWLFGHLDVVPPGEGWKTDPWRACRDGDIVYGRGVEDNQQAVTGMLLLAESLKSLAITPELTLGLVFMADEECGSRHGLVHILEKASELFKKDDLYIVPDGGSPDAASIEIAEKTQLWLKFAVHGKQCHASVPQNGKNAFTVASRLVVKLAGLQHMFPDCDNLFEPPVSTFVPTRHEGNGCAINIMPGSDTFFLDCRLLPAVDPEAVQKRIRSIMDDLAWAAGADIEMTVEQYQASSAISPEAPVVLALKNAISAVYGAQAHPCGIGGASVAAFLREKGRAAAVWACLENTCHQPNEKALLTAACRDAAVFSHILMTSRSDA